MHESSLARQILEAALAHATAAGAARIRVVHGWIADSEALSPESLALHFAAHARGTAADGARLELRLTHVEARCRACEAIYAPDHHVLLCPTCGSTDGALLGDSGLGVETLEVD